VTAAQKGYCIKITTRIYDIPKIIVPHYLSLYPPSVSRQDKLCQCHTTSKEAQIYHKLLLNNSPRFLTEGRKRRKLLRAMTMSNNTAMIHHTGLTALYRYATNHNYTDHSFQPRKMIWQKSRLCKLETLHPSQAIQPLNPPFAFCIERRQSC
jgi:hypothetical protein